MAETKRESLVMHWKRAVSRILDRRLRTSKQFDVKTVTSLKPAFLDRKGELQRLNREEFVRQLTSRCELFDGGLLGQLFDDVDVDVKGSISWDEFTTYVIHNADEEACIGEDVRSREFLMNNVPLDIHYEHKDVVNTLLVNESADTVITAGFDGLLKVWSPLGKHIRTVNNARLSVSRTEKKAGFHVGVTPVTDAVIGSHGAVCYVSGADKSIHLYDAGTLDLQRRYIGRNNYNDLHDLHVTADFIGGSKAPVETVALMGMSEGILSVDVSSCSGREHFFFGLTNGAIAAYPVMRHSSIGEIRSSFVSNVHKSSIAKLRAIHSDVICSCGWDRQLCMTSATTGQTFVRLNGGSQGILGHHKSAFDFAFSQNANLVASIACEREVYIWNPSTENPITKLAGHTALLCGVCFNEQENQLISLSVDNVIKIWDMRNYRVFQSIKHSDRYSELSKVTYDHKNQLIVGAANVPYSWRMRRSLSNFSMGYRGHFDPILAVDRGLDTEGTVLTCDAYICMNWDVKTGTRKNLFSVTSDRSVGTAACLDVNRRRLGISTRNGTLSIYNFSNGQLLKDPLVQMKEPPNRMIHLQDASGKERRFVVQSPSELILVVEPSDRMPEFRFIRVAARKGSFSSVAKTPAVGTISPSLVCGTTEGALMVISGTAGTISSTMTHPTEKIQSRISEDSVEALLGRKAPPPRRVVEGIALLEKKNLFVTVLGGCSIFFWDLFRKNEIVLVYKTQMEPTESLVAITCVENYVIVGDEVGFVYVRNAVNLPPNRPGVVYDESQIQLLWCFRAHQGPIVSLLPLHKTFLVTHGTTDGFVRCFSLSGEFVGYFGQQASWFLTNRNTWNLCRGEPDVGGEKFPSERPRVIEKGRQDFRTGFAFLTEEPSSVPPSSDEEEHQLPSLHAALPPVSNEPKGAASLFSRRRIGSPQSSFPQRALTPNPRATERGRRMIFREKRPTSVLGELLIDSERRPETTSTLGGPLELHERSPAPASLPPPSRSNEILVSCTENPSEVCRLFQENGQSSKPTPNRRVGRFRRTEAARPCTRAKGVGARGRGGGEDETTEERILLARQLAPRSWADRASSLLPLRQVSNPTLQRALTDAAKKK